MMRYCIEFHPIAQPIPTKYMNAIATIAARLVDRDSPSDADLTVRKIAIYSMATSWIRIPDTNDPFRPMWSINIIAQSSDARNFTAPNIAVTKSFSDCPVNPSKENNSGAYT